MARKPSTRSGDTVFATAADCAPAPLDVRLNVTTSAPVTCSSERRSIILFIARPFLAARGLYHRTDDAQMRAAAAKVVRQLGFDLLFRRLRVALQQGGGLHDHAVDAVAALHGLLLDEGLLDWMRIRVRAQPFERHHLAGDRRKRRDA